MSIGFSDGSTAEDWAQVYTQGTYIPSETKEPTSDAPKGSGGPSKVASNDPVELPEVTVKAPERGSYEKNSDTINNLPGLRGQGVKNPSFMTDQEISDELEKSMTDDPDGSDPYTRSLGDESARRHQLQHGRFYGKDSDTFEEKDFDPSRNPMIYNIKPELGPIPRYQQDIMNIDKNHNVPLVASALTKDGRSMYGMAVDHRVPLEMAFNGSMHDLTPFLYTHESSELPVMHDLIKGGMDVQDAYHEAHDKVANPSEASHRFAYAAQAGLDPDEFNQAYYNHIKQATETAKQPSDQPRHPDAHTTKYGLDELENG